MPPRPEAEKAAFFFLLNFLSTSWLNLALWHKRYFEVRIVELLLKSSEENKQNFLIHFFTLLFALKGYEKIQQTIWISKDKKYDLSHRAEDTL